MTHIDFYILESSASQSRLHFAIRLTEKLYREGHHIHLHTDNSAMLSALDTALWTDRDISFIPHEEAAQPVTHCPVTIGMSAFEGTEEILINLASNVPEYFSQMERVLEVIDTQGEDVAQGRERFRFYRDRGYPMKSHSIN
jgi:DNA polymerase-3 subunit chi